MRPLRTRPFILSSLPFAALLAGACSDSTSASTGSVGTRSLLGDGAAEASSLPDGRGGNGTSSSGAEAVTADAGVLVRTEEQGNDNPGLDPTQSPSGGGGALSSPNDASTGRGEQNLGSGFYVMENLDRGLVALPADGGIFLSWRLSGLEYGGDESQPQSFVVYRDGLALGTVGDSTNFFDPEGSPQAQYAVARVHQGQEAAASAAVTPWAEQFLRVPLQSPGANYSAHDSSLGDADGDGQFEIFLLWQPDNAQDNSNDGTTDDVFLDALKLDGTQLWRINLGPNIRAGEHYTQFVVVDSDGDGRAEMGVKTAPGTVAGDGQFLRLGPAATDDDSQVFRNDSGRVLDGPEYFTVFDGLTGVELATVPFEPARGNVNAWGDNYGNRVDRFLATGAYLDDTGLPSFVMARGYYTRTTLGAYNWRNGQLTELWRFDSDNTATDASGQPYTGQGNHNLSVANVDADNGQEIVYGAMVIDHDGQGKCSTGMNHGDALHVGDLIPDRDGIEVFMPTESTNRPHWVVYDPASCEVLRQADTTGNDVGRGVAADVSDSSPGAEFWASAGVQLASASTGQPVGGPQPNSTNFLIWWDADELRELENGTSISKVGGGTLLSCPQCSSNNGTKSVPTLVADLFGDWREEVIWRESDSSALRIYTTTELTNRRLFTLMHDPQYRAAISWQNVAYNQPPHPSFYLGSGMAPPAAPNIRLAPRAAVETVSP